MVDKYEIAEKLYDYELDRKEKINARLPFPVTVAVAMIAWLIWLFTVVDKSDGLPDGAFKWGAALGGISVVLALGCLAFCAVHPQYRTIGSYSDFMDAWSNSGISSMEKFTIQQYATVQKENFETNKAREALLGRTLLLLTFSALCLLAATYWLVSGGGHFATTPDLSVQIKNNPLAVYVDNLASSPAPSCNISIPPPINPPIIHHGPHHHNPVPCGPDTVNHAAQQLFPTIPATSPHD